MKKLARKLAVRLLMLSIFATPLLLVPVITPADAATTSTKHVKKKRVRVVHQNPGFGAAPAKSYSNNPYEDDEDRRKANGGGGGY